MIAAGTLHDDLLLSRGFFAPQRVKSSHNGLFGYPRPPLHSTALPPLQVSEKPQMFIVFCEIGVLTRYILAADFSHCRETLARWRIDPLKCSPGSRGALRFVRGFKIYR